MRKNLKNKKGITMVTLVVTIILLLILAGVSINMAIGEEGLIAIARKAKENMELSQIEEQTKLNELYTQMETGEGGGNIEYGDTGKINEFKKKIAEYIEEAGGVKPEPPETASTETFGESILGLSSQDATATADKILKNYTAYVKGEKITGTLEIPSLSSQTSNATATPDKILKDYTAYVNGKYIVGTMSNNGAVNKTLKAGESYTILPGYHNGSGKIQAADLASQTPGTATSDKIEKGETAWVNGNKIIGNKTNVEIARYDNPYVPLGFEHTEGEWNNGYTIRGNTQNKLDEFVWVPCVLNQNQVREGDIVVTFKKIIEGEYNRLNKLVLLPTDETIEAEDSSVAEIRESVGKYGGFYIAKYEAGITSTSANSALSIKKKTDGSVKPLSQKGKGIWDYLFREEAITVSKAMVNEESTGCKSTLISGEAWDTTLQWMVKASDNKNNEPNISYDIDSSGKGWYSDISKDKLHVTGYFVVNNIYDMAGNASEWTTENCKPEELGGGVVSEDDKIIRGGGYNSLGSSSGSDFFALGVPAASRVAHSSAYVGIGFRVVLYK